MLSFLTYLFETSTEIDPFEEEPAPTFSRVQDQVKHYRARSAQMSSHARMVADKLVKRYPTQVFDKAPKGRVRDAYNSVFIDKEGSIYWPVNTENQQLLKTIRLIRQMTFAAKEAEINLAAAEKMRNQELDGAAKSKVSAAVGSNPLLNPAKYNVSNFPSLSKLDLIAPVTGIQVTKPYSERPLYGSPPNALKPTEVGYSGLIDNTIAAQIVPSAVTKEAADFLEAAEANGHQVFAAITINKRNNMCKVYLAIPKIALFTYDGKINTQNSSVFINFANGTYATNSTAHVTDPNQTKPLANYSARNALITTVNNIDVDWLTQMVARTPADVRRMRQHAQ